LGQTEFRHWRPSTEGRLRKSIGDIRDSSHAAEFGQQRSFRIFNQSALSGRSVVALD
jgi:hypothetical protein